MGRYKFEIQSLITTTVEADDLEQARNKVLDLLLTDVFNESLRDNTLINRWERVD